MKIYYYFITLGLSLFLATSCNSKKTEQKHKEEAKHEEHGEHEEELSLNQAQMNALKLRLGKITERNIPTTLELSGELELPPQSKAYVTPYMSGIVRKILIQEGDKVSKGQIVAYLSQPEFIHLQDQYLSMYNQLRYQKKEYERKKRLYKEQITSGKDFQNIESEYNSTKAKVEALAQKLNLLNISSEKIEKGEVSSIASVKSPISGFVTKIYTNLGKNAASDEPMFQIINNDSLYLSLSVYEKDLNKVKLGQKLNFTVGNDDSSPLEARIYSINPSFVDNSKAVRVNAKIQNPNKRHLMEGMYAIAKLELENRKVPSLPKDAVVSENGKNYIFVQESMSNENISNFHKLQVQIGESWGDYVEIIMKPSLAKEVKVVENNTYQLSSELDKAEREHSH